MFGSRDTEPLPEYEVRISTRSRSVRISVHPDGLVVVTKPVRMSQSQVESFVRKHADWIRSKVASARKQPVPLLGRLGRRDYTRYKEAARMLVMERLERFNAYYGFEYGSVRIRNQKSRWGSCSARGNLNFNYKIALIPPALQDYVIVHELCHLKELNHSEKFWDLVAEQVPDWEAKRKELKKY